MKKEIKQFIVYILISFLLIYILGNMEESFLKTIGGFSILTLVLYISNKIAKWLIE